MKIEPCVNSDIEIMFHFYEQAIEFQKQVSNQHWKPFEHSLVAKEIEQGLQWKIVIDGKIACVFLATFSDPHIWGERNIDPAVYIHRIVTNPEFRGRLLVKTVFAWAKVYAKHHGKKFLRMDTWGENQKLVEYYQRFGFRFLEVITPLNVNELPAHYSCITLSLLEQEVL